MKKYIVEIPDEVKVSDELVPFDMCRPSWWIETYDAGVNAGLEIARKNNATVQDNDLKEARGCPFCGKKPIFMITSLGMERDLRCIYFKFGCDKCHVYAPTKEKAYRVEYGLKSNGELWLKEDMRNNAISAWNGGANNG